jgi:CheY-like chemotaxis protein
MARRREVPVEETGQPPLILVVDDDLDDREAIGELLEQAGYRVDRAVDAADALSLAALRPPALVTVDLHMPNMDGYEIARRLRQEVGLRVPIVAVTGRTPPNLEGLFDEVFFKPLAGNHFLDYVRRQVTPPLGAVGRGGQAPAVDPGGPGAARGEGALQGQRTTKVPPPAEGTTATAAAPRRKSGLR